MHSGKPLKLNYAFDVNQNCSNNCWGSQYLTRSAGRAHRVAMVGIYIPDLHTLQTPANSDSSLYFTPLQILQSTYHPCLLKII